MASIQFQLYRRAAVVIALTLIVGATGSSSAQQPPTTFRQALAGAPDAERFPATLLDTPIPTPRPGRRYVTVGVHVNPSAERLFVFSGRKFVRVLDGWELATLADESIVYHENVVHVAPTHSVQISVFDPAANVTRRIYPPSPADAVRLKFIQRVAVVYKARGEAWFRDNNHHMDATRFNSALTGSIEVDETSRSMTFLVRYGNVDPGRDPVTFSELVRVTCAPLTPVDRIQCRETLEQ